jgi:hypothetical protein
MTTQELLDLDYNNEESKKLIQKALRKIKPFKDFDENKEVPLLLLETLVGKYERKYCLMINYITPTFIPGERNIYCATIKRTDTMQYLENVYGTSLYELFAKLCIKFFYEVNKNDVPEQDWDKLRRERQKRIKEFFDEH